MLKTLKMTTTLAGTLFAGTILACAADGSSGFLPENDLRIPVGLKSIQAGITEQQFNSAIDKVVNVYAPIVSNMGAKLTVERKWTDATVNAYALRTGNNWSIAMFGGLARHASITEDGMALVVCHELGHHIGGAPKKGAGLVASADAPVVNKWSGAEGQADYFATLKCLRKVFLNENNTAIVAKLNAPKYVVDACNKATNKDKQDSAICIRTSMAGKSVSNLFAALSRWAIPETKFETPDRKAVSKTDDNHPAAQCRLDTYFQGSLCDVAMNEDVSQTDEVKGTCHPSLGYKTGLRPLCWFKPKK